jgi:hypothetical protein
MPFRYDPHVDKDGASGNSASLQLPARARRSDLQLFNEGNHS